MSVPLKVIGTDSGVTPRGQLSAKGYGPTLTRPMQQIASHVGHGVGILHA